jgi:hypothetical protein
MAAAFFSLTIAPPPFANAEERKRGPDWPQDGFSACGRVCDAGAVLHDLESAPGLGATRAGEDDPFRCRGCGEALAPRSARMDLSPDTFVSPEGLVFALVGVRVAPGCTTVGTPTRYWTWFPGCAWQSALCRRCRVQVGWSYTGASTFAGLIRERVE